MRRIACATALAWSATALVNVHAATTTFVGVRDSSLPQAEYDSGNYTYTQSQLLTDTSAVASATIPTSAAQAQTLYGVNRVGVANNAAVDDETLRTYSIGGPFAAAISIWSDQITITGGTGAGTATVSTHLTGQFGPGYGSAGNYYLFVATADDLAALQTAPLPYLASHDLAPVSVLSLEQNVLKPGTYDPGESLAPGSPFGGTLTGTLDFQYGESFYLVSLLAGYANDFGSLDAMHSAVFGITPSAGDQLVSASGAHYLAAVPEPQTWALLAAGLICLVWVYRRAQRRD